MRDFVIGEEKENPAYSYFKMVAFFTKIKGKPTLPLCLPLSS